MTLLHSELLLLHSPLLAHTWQLSCRSLHLGSHTPHARGHVAAIKSELVTHSPSRAHVAQSELWSLHTPADAKGSATSSPTRPKNIAGEGESIAAR